MIKKILLPGFFLFLLFQASCIYQRPDMQANTFVAKPMFNTKSAPNVLFDAGHNNFHNIETTYAPFASLMKNDGINLKTYSGTFTQEKLKGVDLLIIANAMVAVNEKSAFLNEEILVLKDWVKRGGALLLIADHDPFGSASANLAKSFGVGMASVWTVDTLRTNNHIGKNTWLEYKQENNGLGQHSIFNANESGSAISKVITFTGQSLSYDSTWTPILKLSASAQNYYNRADAKELSADPSTFYPAPNQAQLIACEYGEGRIVIAAEAAMFTAQEVRIFFKHFRAGFNYEGYQNKQLILNIIHWLLFEIE